MSKIPGRCPTCNRSLAHPVWDFLKFALVCALLTTLLAMEATNFDITELRVIAAFGVVIAIFHFGFGEYLMKILQKRYGS